MILRVTQVFSTLFLLMLVCGVGGFAASKVIDQSLPGSPVFQIRQAKENLDLMLAVDPEAQEAQRLAIINARLNDFSARAGTAYELPAFNELENAMNAGIAALAELPQAQRIDMLKQIADGMASERQVFDKTAFALDKAWLAQFDNKAALIRQASEKGSVAPEYLRQIAAPLPAPDSLIISPAATSNVGTPRMVPMPTAFKHSFPLDGAHMTTPCEKCHIKSLYEGTPRDCISCHRDVHTPTLGWGCADCHTTTAWTPVKKR